LFLTGAKLICIVFSVYFQVLPIDEVIELYGSTVSQAFSHCNSVKLLIGYKKSFLRLIFQTDILESGILAI
jgi:hypothetical protein